MGNFGVGGEGSAETSVVLMLSPWTRAASPMHMHRRRNSDPNPNPKCRHDENRGTARMASMSTCRTSDYGCRNGVFFVF